MSSFFHLTSNERRGVFGALFLMICIVTFKLYNNQLDKAYIISAEIEVEARKDSLIDVMPAIDEARFRKKSVEKVKNIKLLVKKIKPNFSGYKDWVDLGIPEDVSLRIYKYIKLQNGITKASDLLSVYGFKNDWFVQLKDSLDFTIEKVDIQIASELELTSIKGIGEIYAQRIVKYRKLLGGYTSVSQLTEVYGIDNEILEPILGSVTCSSKNTALIDVNTCGYNVLSKHPYISDSDAMAIIQKRSAIGNLSKEDVRTFFSERNWIRIKKYLK